MDLKSSEYKIFETKADRRKNSGDVMSYRVTKNHYYLIPSLANHFYDL